MSSQRRIQSSRANGAKSRGPVTAAGRRKSSQNNLRHGLLAEAVVLDEENPEAFFELLGNLTHEHNPQTETQRILVETMAIARWRLTRLWALERETLQAEIHKRDPAEHSASARAALAFRGLADQGRMLDILNRHESRLDRQYARSLNLLMKLAAPDNPLTQFRHTNPVPQSDTAQALATAGDLVAGSFPPATSQIDLPPAGSGIGLPACPGDEVASLAPCQPAPPESFTHAEPTSLPDPRPLTPDPQFAPACPGDEVASLAPSQPAPPESSTHAEPTSLPDPRPLTPDPQFAPACPGDEVASLPPSQPTPPDSPTHAEPTSFPAPRPLTPDPQPVPQSQHLQNPTTNPATPNPPTAYKTPHPVPGIPNTPENHPPHG